MKKILFILGIIGAIFLAYYCVTKDAPRIEQDITQRVTERFNLNGLSSNITSTVDGRDVTLNGVVSDEVVKIEAGRTAQSLYGVRTVNNNIKVANIPAPEPVVERSPEPVSMPPMEEPSFDFDMEQPQPIVMDNVEIVAEQPPVITEPIVEPEALLEPVIVETAPVVEDQPVIVYEEPKLDEPLKVRNGRIIRRGVDTVTAQKTSVAKCENDLTSVLWNNKINFDSGRATIKKSSYALLDKAVIAAKNCHKDTIITINGYTDNVGDPEGNRQLSLRRAKAVGKYMLKRGVAKQVKVVGHGENNPIADNDTEAGRAENRRIEFKVFEN